MISLKKYKKMTFIIIIFSLIIFTFSIVSSILISAYKTEHEANNLQNKDTKYIKFSESNKVAFNDILSILDGYTDSNICIEYDPIPKYLNNDTLFGKGIYYNYNLDNKFPILDGRNFTPDEINSIEKKILVGKNLTSEIVTENNINYFLIGEEKFLVIGILGNSDNKTGYDNTFIINLKSSNEFSDSRARWKLNVNNEIYLDAILNKFNQLALNNNINLNLNNEDFVKTNLIDIIGDYPEFINILLMVFVLGVINLIIVVYYWMDKNIKEIGVRKAYGGTNFKICLHILKQYELSVIISLIIGMVAHLTFKNFLKAIFPMFSFDLCYENIILVTILFMIIGLLVAIIPLLKAKKVQPISIMKGCLK